METKTLKPYFVVIGLMALTSLALAFTINVQVSEEAGVRMDLPDRVGEWTGYDLLFCQNKLCQREYRSDELEDTTVCPECGGVLDTMTWAEKDLLPPDTEIRKKVYRNPSGRSVSVSVVLSGRERASIHRPQVCLVGQGNEIVDSTVMAVPIQGREPLDIMSLEMLRRYRGQSGRRAEVPTYFAYWFVGKGRETPYHVQRMIWMASDRIFRNVSHRWAYIAVSGLREKDSDDYQEEVVDFVQNLYPQIVLQ